MKKKKLKLDIACGQNKQKGFVGVDYIKKGTQANIEQDLLKFPWPFKDNSVDEIFCSHFIEHIPHGNDGHHDPFFDFFTEVWRIMKKGGKATFVTPYYTSIRAFQDPTHQRFITEATYLYLTHEWRDVQNKLSHYPIKTDFHIDSVNHGVYDEFVGRAAEAVQNAAQHEWNVITDLIVVISKPK